MWANLRADYRRAYAQTSYRGALRKAFFTLTSPGFQAVWGYRLARWLMRAHIPLVGAVLQRFIEVWTGISLPPEATVGPGFLIQHFGGIVVNGNAVIGSDCTVHHGVTIGNRVSGGPSPRIGHRVMVGVGAVLLGGITIGDDAEIGANAVVVTSIPDGAVAVGIPARVVRIKTGQGGATPVRISEPS